MAAILVFSSPGETLVRGHPQAVPVGNTMRVAQQLAQRLAVPIQQIRPREPYPTDYHALLERARTEHEQAALPVLQSSSPITDDVWFVGYPIWFGDLPRPVATLLSQTSNPPRVLYPFATHEGSGLGRSIETLTALAPTATVMSGLPIRGSRADRAACALDHWLLQYFSTSQS
ncbi:MAG TPA: flavodoxin [Candidatus Levilactobacillus faecigallinarum]|uniref:Flavodoxin n=1 Tax=Candidatus Levilactobacillus faecigallinarum TaxID=2838638 RepID=A0A9D1QV59_9LACO|nr:flavodoxin [Candidatus Levilactobacillus faecigallinarum]